MMKDYILTIKMPLETLDDVEARKYAKEKEKEWNIPEFKKTFELPNGNEIQVTFPGHMPPDLNGRRSLREHKDELEKAGFKILKCYRDEMPSSPSVPGNQVMIAFAYKEK